MPASEEPQRYTQIGEGYGQRFKAQEESKGDKASKSAMAARVHSRRTGEI
jgi:hypothetical protein